MLSRVTTTRRAGRSYILSALAACYVVAPYLCRSVNTGSHLLKDTWNNGGHGPVCKPEGHPLAALCRYASLQAFPLSTEKEVGDAENLQNSYIQSSASTLRSRKGRSSLGNLKVSDAHGLFPDDEEKVSESNATLAGSKASRNSKRAVKGSKTNLASSSSSSKESKKTTFLSYGDAMVSESEATCNQGLEGHFREGNACEACGQDARGYVGGGDDSEATALARHAELQNPSSTDDPLILPVSQGQEDSSSSVPCAHSGNTVPLQSLVISTRLKGTEKSQIALLDLQQKIELLEAEKVSFYDAERLFKTRAFKFASFAQLSAVLGVLKELFGDGEEACHALASSSKFLEHPAELLQVLKVLADFKIEKEATSKLLIYRYSPLSLKVEVLQKKLSFFKDLGFSAEDLNTLLRRQPCFLSRSLEKCILPTLEFLESIGFTEKEVLRLLQRRSGVCNYRDELIKKCKFLQELGLTTSKISIALCVLWQYSIEKLRERVQDLKDLGFSDEDVMLMIRHQPSLLSYTPEGLKARIDYLVRDQNRDMSEIVKCPICLMCSLDRRIIPRFRCIEKLSLSKVYSLSFILCNTDRRFKEKLGIVQ